jgi:hypothetical protein
MKLFGGGEVIVEGFLNENCCEYNGKDDIHGLIEANFVVFT